MFVRREMSLAQVGAAFKLHYSDGALRPCTALSTVFGSSAALALRYQHFFNLWIQGLVFGAEGHMGDFPSAEQLLQSRKQDVVINFHGGNWGGSVSPSVQDLSAANIRLLPEHKRPPPDAKLVVNTKYDPNDFALRYYYLKRVGKGEYERRETKPYVDGVYGDLVLDMWDQADAGGFISIINVSAEAPYTARKTIDLGVQEYPFTGMGVYPVFDVHPGGSFTLSGWGYGKQPGWLYIPQLVDPIAASDWAPTKVRFTIPGSAPPDSYRASVYLPCGPGGRCFDIKGRHVGFYQEIWVNVIE